MHQAVNVQLERIVREFANGARCQRTRDRRRRHGGGSGVRGARPATTDASRLVCPARIAGQLILCRGRGDLLDSLAGQTSPPWPTISRADQAFGLAHDPEKWMPVFGNRSCSNKKIVPTSIQDSGYRAAFLTLDRRGAGARPLSFVGCSGGETSSGAGPSRSASCSAVPAG